MLAFSRGATGALVALFLSSPLLGQTWSEIVPKDSRIEESARPYQSAPIHQVGDRVLEARITGAPFAKYLTYQNYLVRIGKAPAYQGGFVYGPGHHISALAALIFDPRGTPYATFKSGDTRLSRALRGEPYVATSGIAGRWDKKGVSAGDIVLAELAEEVGGRPVEETFRRLGDSLSPTMPLESTESDEYFMAAVELDGTPYGDGGQMEVLGLIGPVFYSPWQAIRAMDDGSISDSARARTMFARAWDAIGYLPELEVYVHDYPELRARFDTLGLGPVKESWLDSYFSEIPAPRKRDGSLASRVNTVSVINHQRVPLGEGLEMMDARIQHAVRDTAGKTPLEPSFASQYLRTDYDRAKVAVYYLDPEKGPMVEMTPQARPALAFAPGDLKVVRRDLRDLQVPKSMGSVRYHVRQPSEVETWDEFAVSVSLRQVLPETPELLSPLNAASSGQSDLFYWSFACRIDPPAGRSRDHFVTLAEAIRLCRTGHGDAQSEATLLRLATHLDWLPQLGMARSTVYSRLFHGRGR